MGRACSQNGGKQECFQNSKGKPTGKRLLGRPRRRLEENIRMDLKGLEINRVIGFIRLKMGIIGEPL